MGVFVGGTEIPDDGVIQVGGQTVQSIFVGRTQVWPPSVIVGTERVVQDLEQRVVQDGVDIRVVQQSSPTVGGFVLQEDGTSKIILEEGNGFLLLEGQPPTQTGVPITTSDDWQTIVDANPAGTTYRIQAGVHVQQTMTVKAGDTVIFEQGAVARGSRVLTGWQVAGSNWEITGQDDGGVIHHDGGTPTNFENPDPIDGKNYENGWRSNELFTEVSGVVTRRRHAVSLADMDSESWFFDYNTGVISIGFDPATVDEIRMSDTMFCILGKVDNVTVMAEFGNTGVITEYASPLQNGVVMPVGGFFDWTDPNNSGATGNFWLVQNLTFSLCHGSALMLGWNMRVTECLITRMGLEGVMSKAHTFNTVPITEGIEFDHNEVSFCNALRGWRYWWGGGGKLEGVSGADIHHNWFHDNLHHGFWLDIKNGGNTRIHHNLFENNAFGGIFWEISFDCEIYQNLFRHNGWKNTDVAQGAAIQIGSQVGGTLADVYENIIELTDGGTTPVGIGGDGIMVKDDSRVIDGATLTVRNNKTKWFYRTGQAGRTVFNGIVFNNAANTTSLNSTWNNNDYVYVGPNTDDTFRHPPTNYSGGFSAPGQTLTEWRGFGKDLASTMVFNTTPVANTAPSAIPTWTDVFDGEV